MSEAIRFAATLIEALGGLVIGYTLVAAFAVVARGRLTNLAIEAMRYRLATGIVSALGLMTAATMLKTINLRTWSAIGMFVVVLALRTLVKSTLAAEARSAEPR